MGTPIFMKPSEVKDMSNAIIAITHDSLHAESEVVGNLCME